MSMQELNLTTHPHQTRRGVALVRMSKKTGTTTFTKAAAEKIEVKHGSKIVFQISADGDIYITKTYGTEGFPLRGKTSKQLMFNNISLAKHLMPQTATKTKWIIGDGTEIAGRMCYPLINMEVYQ